MTDFGGLCFERVGSGELQEILLVCFGAFLYREVGLKSHSDSVLFNQIQKDPFDAAKAASLIASFNFLPTRPSLAKQTLRETPA